jgi:hypothetical protein
MRHVLQEVKCLNEKRGAGAVNILEEIARKRGALCHDSRAGRLWLAIIGSLTGATASGTWLEQGELERGTADAEMPSVRSFG